MNRHLGLRLASLLTCTLIFTGFAGALDTWTALSPLPTPANLSAVNYSSGQYLATGFRNIVLSSPDAAIWQVHEVQPVPLSASIRDTIWGNGQFVAVGTKGQIFTSTDLVTWTAQWSGVIDDLSSISFGDGRFVVVGGSRSDGRQTRAILHSTDGIFWTVEEVSIDQPALNKVRFLNNAFWAVGDSETLMTSKTGTSWQMIVSGGWGSLSGVAYGDGRLVVVGTSGRILLSNNGVDWTTNQVPGQPNLVDVEFGAGLFVSVGIDTNYDIGTWSSPDGNTWSHASQSNQPPAVSISFAAGQFVAVGDHGSVATSISGTNWLNRSSGTGVLFQHVACGHGLLTAVGGSAVEIAHHVYEQTTPLLTSKDGTNWSPPLPQLKYGFFAVSFAGGQFFVAGSDNAAPTQPLLAVSPNGLQWDVLNVGPSAPLKIAFGDGIYVGVGAGFYLSHNGHDWIKNPVGVQSFLATVAYGAGRFVALGDSGDVYVSTRGTNWTHTNIKVTGLKELVYGNNQFIAVGSANGQGQIATSSDGLNWTNRVIPQLIQSIAFGAGSFVVVGDGGTIVSSMDGINWIARSSIPPVNLSSVGYANGKFFAVGSEGVVLEAGNLQLANLYNPRLSSTGFLLDLLGPPGQVYQVQSSAELTSPDWTDLGTVTISNGKMTTFTDPRTNVFSRGFYRAVTQ